MTPHRYDADMTAEVLAFAARIEPQNARWGYCLRSGTYLAPGIGGGDWFYLNRKSFPVCARILGIPTWRAQSTMGRLLNFPDKVKPGALAVGPLQPWLIGHVYFARLRRFQHIMKIGFSRRVHERLSDLERQTGEEFARPIATRVGTALDEQWRHRHWQEHRISGEWFFDPQMADRTLPSFLQPEAIAA